MFVKTVAGLALLVNVSINPGMLVPDDERALINLPQREKTAIIHPLVHVATECVAKAVVADPRLGKSDMNSLIVDSFKNCVEPMRAMIDAHDRYYGSGSGQQFFMGPYLDALPAAVNAIVGNNSH
jgi:hypothetical protein